jgi:hypothetical protein
MSWLSTLAVALLTAVAGATASLALAVRWSSWYRWSSFEGASGYAVALWGLVGLVLGALAGAAVSRTAGPALGHSVPRTLGAALALVVGAVAVLGVAGRALADVPPRIDGERLLLLVEVRWPAAQRERPAAPAGRALLRFSRFTGGAPAAVATGRLWTEDLRREPDGRWVAPGAVPVSTARGRRALDVVLDDAREAATTHGVLVPLPGSLGAADLAWSRWMPASPPGAPPLADGFQLRYRVQPASRPARTETVGPFTVDAVVGDRSDPRGDVLSHARLVVRHHGRPVRLESPAGPGDETDRDAPAEPTLGVAAVAAGPRAALLVWNEGVGGPIALVVDEGERVRTEVVAHASDAALVAHPLTDAAERFHAAPRTARRGEVDRALLATPGAYLVGDAVLDTRTLTVRRLPQDSTVAVSGSVPPLALSPDGRSVVRYAERPSDGEQPAARPVLLVADVAAGRTHAVPIDRARMRYADPRELDPAWVAHHFAWARGADGADRLTERAGFVPLPRRGRVVEDTPGVPLYVLAPARPALADAVVELLAAELRGERLPPLYAGGDPRVRAEGQVVTVGYDERLRAVTVAPETYRDTAGVVRRIARHADAALAAGRYDHLFDP